ncbi:MAG TPA: DUF4911 domain-containing protein [Syntrophorhabdaceae bacterium]|nr:DUF4911 domain-containing protein [Syntrophorhabdaceae bacterium]
MIERMEGTKKFIIEPQYIGFFKAILESYEDIGIFSVLDGKIGLIEVIYPISFQEDIDGIIADMRSNGIQFKEVSDVR